MPLPLFSLTFRSFFRQSSGDTKKSGQPSAISGPNMAIRSVLCVTAKNMSYDRAVSAKYRDTRKIILLPTCFFTAKTNKISKKSLTPMIFIIFDEDARNLPRKEKIFNWK